MVARYSTKNVLARFVAIGLAMAGACATSLAKAAPVPIAYYNFEGNFQDSSGNGHHGALVGSQIGIVNDPTRGNVLSMNYSPAPPDFSWINLNGATPFSAFPATGGITIATWAKQSATATSFFDYMFSFGLEGDNPIISLGILPDGRAYSYIESNSLGNDQRGIRTADPIGVGAWDAWHHLALVINRDANSAQFYVDGVAVGTEIRTSTLSPLGVLRTGLDLTAGSGIGTANSVRLGSFNGTGRLPFVGLVDEFRIYGSALNQAEIQEIMAIPEPAAASLLMAGLAVLSSLRRRRG